MRKDKFIMVVNDKKFFDLYDSVLEEVEMDLEKEPVLMRSSRVEEILDIVPFTRKRLVNSGELTAVKTGDSVQSAMRITKESVTRLIAKWQAIAEYKAGIK